MSASVYDTAKVDTILARIADGDSQDAVCKEVGISPTIFRVWVLDDKDGLAAKYARARAMQMEAHEQRILDAAYEDDDPNRSRLKIDAHKWLMSKLLPKKYGDKQQVELTGKDGERLYGWGDEKPKL